MMDFQERLAKAIERGNRAGDARARAEHEAKLNEEELRRLHREYQLELSEKIEACLKSLPEHFPGFRYETIVGPKGWGGAVSRDDVGVDANRRRANYFSRLEIVVRPLSEYFVLDLATKGTVRNKEILSHNHYQLLAEVDLTSFTELIDRWVLDFAERYAASR
ncbi:MAG: hypothetical protein JW818_15025 [Pirellulales bacterium]|nr:hypothetical protein [Pirellulales bacterium]